ncbi:MAG: hypothetical protein HN576_05180 [Bacteriovoracaceae bacterium]|jgi:hypothetical protein|nr:hypothetical protein [Bacteriovoracaceae bacterium]
MKMFLFTLVLLSSQAIIAGEFLLLSITNEVDTEITKFVLVTDDANQEILAFYKKTYTQSGNLITENVLAVNQIAATTGIILDRRDNRNIIVLRSENFAAHHGGDLEIDTLYNGITRSRKTYPIDLQRHGANWKIERYGKVITQMHLVSKKILGKVVGIKDIKTK